MARSALYPRLSLGGSVLYAYNMTQNRRSNNNFVPAGGPTIDIPLWDWGARQAQVKAGEQGIAAALAGYRKAVLSGVSEVEESLSALARERERIAALDEARRVLDRRNGSQRKLASLGLSSPYDGLEGRRALLEAQSDVALARARGPWPSSRSTRRWAAPAGAAASAGTAGATAGARAGARAGATTPAGASMIALARKTLVYEWRRFVPVVLAVGFSGLMLVVQAALVLGIFGASALYVNASSADLWAGYPGTQSVNFGRTVSADAEMRLRMDPEVVAVEPYQWVDGDWTPERVDAGSVSIYLSGIAVGPDAMLFSKLLPPDLRKRLREPGR